MGSPPSHTRQSVARSPGRLRALAFRVYGQPPAEGAPRSEVLRYVRRFYTRNVPPLLLVGIVWAVVGWQHPWEVALFAVPVLIFVQGFTSISFRIRREERRERQ